jgi:hypothetical protein
LLHVPLLALVLAGSSTNLCYQFLAGGLGPAKKGGFQTFDGLPNGSWERFHGQIKILMGFSDQGGYIGTLGLIWAKIPTFPWKMLFDE